MNLLDLAVKITCDDQASGQVEGIGSKITGALGTAAKVGGAAVAALGAATVGVGKMALDAYADYEQLVGGIDTLFKDSSAKMQQYAADAYQTAGVSANRYMEISTSFAASLISSLGGDTAAAADMANMAIQDMSDNANKMGTDLEVVQEAYQSLARGNYEMLDSLKLGYGGTKAELERLLSDAEQVAASQGMVRDFSVDSYADVVEAIHLVQDEMGITGTTAAEAATTISGSVNSMKAAWENWLAGLGNEDADMSALTSSLLDSIGTVIDNVGPRVGMIVGTLATEIISQGPEIGLSLATMVGDAFTDAMNLILGIIGENTVLPTLEFDPSGIVSGVDAAVTKAGEVLGYLQETFGPGIQQAMELVGPIVEQVGRFFSHMGTQIQTVLGPALDYLGPAFTNFMSALQPWIEPLGNVAQIFGSILVAAISAFTYALGGVMNIFAAVTAVITDFDAFLSGQPSVIGTVIQGIIAWFQQLPGNIASFLGSVISSVVSWVGEMASNAVSAGSQFLNNVVEYVSSLPGRIASFLGSVISRVTSWVGRMASNATNAASRFARNLISGLQSIPGRVVDIGGQIIQGMVDGVVEAAGDLIDAVGGAVNDAIGWAKGLLGIASPSKVFREIGQFTMQGAALGVEDDAPMLARSTEDAMHGMVTATSPVPSIAVAGASSAVNYNIYLDGSLVAVDSRIGSYMERFVNEVTGYVNRGRVRA